MVLLKLGSFIIVSFFFFFGSLCLCFFPLPIHCLGISYFSSVTVNVCYERKTPLSLEDFMPLPGDFKLINHIKCFAVPRPESPGSVPRAPEIVHKQTIKIKDKAQK